MRKIKILYIHHGTGIGGALISLFNIIKQLDKRIFEAKVVFLKNSDAVDFFQNNQIAVEVLNISSKSFALHLHTANNLFKAYNVFKIFFVLINWLKISLIIAPKFYKKQDVDIVHLNSVGLSSWAYAAKKANIRVVCHIREPIAQGLWGLRKKLLRDVFSYASDHMIYISQDNKNRIGLEEKATVVYNFVKIPSVYKKPFGDDTESVKVLYMGGSMKVKGFNVIVDSLKYLSTGVILQIAGSLGSVQIKKGILNRIKHILKFSIYRSRYSRIKKLNNASNVQLIGITTEPMKCIDNCDILITPFTKSHFSRPAIEAFACGKPVIASNVEGMDEIVDHGINGLIIKQNNAKELAQAIKYLCDNPNKARQMGMNGREKAKNLFSFNNVKQIESIYLNLMRENK